MPLKTLTIETLGEMGDEFIGAAFRVELERIARDLTDRPQLEAKRKLTLALEFTPRTNSRGVCERACVGVELKTSLPNQKVELSEVSVSANGKMAFRPDSPEDVNQTTFKDKH